MTELFVSVSGRDSWVGSKSRPFATLERARDEIRRLKKRLGGLPPGGVAVRIRGGGYVRTATFELGPEDSGTPDAPVEYRAEGGEVRLIG